MNIQKATPEEINHITQTLHHNYVILVSENQRLKEELKQHQMSELRPEVRWFAWRMERKLRENDYKKHWSKLHQDYLIERLYQEANELWRAIRDGEPFENVIDEAADVANIAMMIADNAEMRERRRMSDMK